jgi:hypothetical protein
VVGITATNSTVMLPLSPETESTANQIGENAPHLVALHDHHEQAGKAHRGHGPRAQGFPAFDFSIEDAPNAA